MISKENLKAKVDAPARQYTKGLTAMINDIYKKPYFSFRLILSANENIDEQMEFKSQISKIKIEDAYMFILSDDDKIWIPFDQFTAKKSLQPLNDENSWDLSLHLKVFQNRNVVIKALEYCALGFAKVNEKYETIPFLLCCFLLNIERPFTLLEKFFKNNPTFNFVLSDPTEILQLNYFIEQYQENSQSQNFKLDESPVYEILSLINELLIKSNPTYFLVNNDWNQVSPLIRNLSQNYFLNCILDYVGKLLFDAPQIEFSSVKKFYQVIFTYFQEQKDGENESKQIFEQLYNQSIASQLMEEDQIQCFPFLPSSKILASQLIEQKTAQFQELKKNESCFNYILMSQITSNMALKQQKNHREILDFQIEDQIEQLINEEIQRLQNQNNAQGELQYGELQAFAGPNELQELAELNELPVLA